MVIKNKNILCISTTAFFNDRGCHIRIERICDFLKHQNNSINLITYSYGKNRKNIPINRINKIFNEEYDYIGFHYKKIILDFFIFMKVLNVLKKKKYDYILAFTHEAGVIALIVKAFTKKKYILDYQGSLYSELVKHKRIFIIFKIILQFIENLINKKSDLIIFNTKNNYDKFNYNKIIIDDNYLPAKIKPIHSFREYNEEKIIVWIGILTEIQGYKKLFQLIERMNNSNIKFVVIGYPVKEKYKQELKNFNVIFTGKINWEYIPSILQDADICISTKEDSSEGNSKLYLYNKYCKNTIALDSLSVREILKDENSIVHSIDEMKEKILMILEKK